MTGTGALARREIFEPLFNEAVKRAGNSKTVYESIDERSVYCFILLSSSNLIPAEPGEIACLLLDFASKMECFRDILDDINPGEIKTWGAIEILFNALIKENAEEGIRCIEITTLYQIRYWSRSSERFRGTEQEKIQYMDALTSLLGKLRMLNINFEQFDNWYFNI